MKTIIKEKMADRDKLIRFLYEIMLIKKLSPEKAAAFIGCSGNQVRRWIIKGDLPTPAYRRMIEKGIKKIKREIPGDENGLVPWGKAFDKKVDTHESAIDKKLNAFFVELVTAARSTGHKLTTKDDENLEGFEEIVHLAAKLKVKLPEI